MDFAAITRGSYRGMGGWTLGALKSVSIIIIALIYMVICFPATHTDGGINNKRAPLFGEICYSGDFPRPPTGVCMCGG